MTTYILCGGNISEMTDAQNEIEKLHQKYARSPKAFEVIFTHCKIVAEIAGTIAQQKNLQLDYELLEVGALLHDIGVYALMDENGNIRNGGFHGLIGEAILRGENYPREIWRFASHHTGVGLTKSDIEKQHLPLPVKDYLAKTTEEELVMYADNFHSKSNPPYFNNFSSYEKEIAKFGDDKLKKFHTLAEKFGRPDLGFFAEKYNYRII